MTRSIRSILLSILITGICIAQPTQVKIFSNDGEDDEEFGHSVSISGNYAIIGAFRDDDNGNESGSAYIFKRTGSNWSQMTKLLPTDGSSGDEFGYSVAIDGDYAIIGAHEKGAAYIFKRNINNWVQQSKLVPIDGVYSFGYSVAIRGEFAIVGAKERDSAYIFKRVGNNWVQQAKLEPDNGECFFGYSVAIDGDYIIVGAPEDDENGDESGSAYIFQKINNTWIEQLKLFPDDAAVNDEFGISVDIKGDYVIIGAHKDNSQSGSAYIFKRCLNSWIQQVKLYSNDSASGDYFGNSVSISNKYVIIGAVEDSNGNSIGSAYLFQKNGNNWFQKTKLLPASNDNGSDFGKSVFIDNENAIIGAPYFQNNSGDWTGLSYIISDFNEFPSEIILQTPNCNEDWIIGETEAIEWSSVGVSGNVKIEVNGNYPSGTWETLFSSTANDGSEIWTVSGVPGPAKRIRISSVTEPGISDISDDNFSISYPPIGAVQVNTPNGGETWIAGTTENITWTYTGNISGIDLQYTTDNGVNWVHLDSPDKDSSPFNWTIPASINSSQCKVKIIGYYFDQETVDISNNTFSILIPSITVTDPNGGEVWLVGTLRNITWGSTAISQVNISYSITNGNSWLTVANNVNAASGSYSWTIPNTPSTECLVKITDATNANSYDVSNNVFTISTLPEPEITVITPNGGENWPAGSQQIISWTSTDISKVDIGYQTTSSGSGWQMIAINVDASQGSYNWTIPNTPSTECLIKISKFLDTSISDVSDGFFSINSSSTQQLVLNSHLTITADQIISVGNIFTASGNVAINDILKYNGEVVVDLNELSISGNCKIYVENIPVLGTVDLYEGVFEYEYSESMLLGLAVTEENNLFELADLPVHIDNLLLLSDGIQIEGNLELPQAFGHVQAGLSALQITLSEGLKLAGSITISDIKIRKTVDLDTLALFFDTINNTFGGKADISTPILKIDASTEIINGQLNSVSIVVGTGQPIPIGTTGLSISQGGGGIDGIANPPLTLFLTVSLVPSVPGSENVVELEDLTLSYTFGEMLEGSGSLKVFDNGVSNVFIRISKPKLSFGGDVNFADILLGNVEAGISKDLQSQFLFEGILNAQLVIPAQEDFPFDYISVLYGLPYAVASTYNQIRNTNVSGSVQLSNIFELTYGLNWDGTDLNATWGANFNNYNNTLFQPEYLMNDFSKQRSNRFEGKSLVIGPNRINNSLSVSGSQMTQSFNLNTQTNLIVIRVEGTDGLPDYAIVLPNGQEVNAQNVNLFSGIEYIENTVERKTFYAIKNPQLGDYLLNINGTNTYYVDVFGTNNAPTIEFENIQQNGNTIDIFWNDDDIDNNANINLYYDDDNYGANGVLIAQDIPEDDLADHFSWTPDSVSTGLYHIYATIQDSSNAITTSYANRAVKLLAENAPNPPNNLTYVLSDTSIHLSWEKTSNTPSYFKIYYDSDGDVTYNSPSYNVGDTTSFELKNFLPGKTYQMMVTSVDTLYNESDYSNIVAFTYISTSQNNAPSIIANGILSQVLVNEPYFYHIETFDPDGDNLTFDLIHKPTGMTIDGSGNINWIPNINQTGSQFIKLKVIDTGGLGDSLLFRIMVLDSLSSTGNISFNKPQYSGYNDNGTIIMSDLNLNLSPATIDSHRVMLFSSSEIYGTELLLKETNANSGLFSAPFYPSNTTSGNGKIFVNPEDSLWVIYIDQFPFGKITDISIFNESAMAIDTGSVAMPFLFSLDNAYPNPFNPTVFIRYTLPVNSEVSLEIYNSLGQRIKSIVRKNENAGTHLVQWDGTDYNNEKVASGLYFYKLVAKSNGKTFSNVKKMIMLK